MTLYEITDELRELTEALEELTPDAEARLDELAHQVESKADSICRLLANLEGERLVLEREATRLMDAAGVKDRAIGRLKGLLKDGLQRAGLQRLSTPLFSLWVQKNSTPSVSIAEGVELPKEFLRVKVEPDMKALAAAWKDGRCVDGVSVSIGTHLRVK